MKPILLERGRQEEPLEIIKTSKGDIANNWKSDIFHIQTPFSIILDSLESSQRALQYYADKHHSTTIYNKNKWGKVKPLFRKPEMLYLLQMMSE